MAEGSLHHLRDHLAECGQGGAVIHAVRGGELVKQSPDAFGGIAVSLADVGRQVAVQQGFRPVRELLPGAAIGRRIQVLGEFVDEGLDSPRCGRLGSHAAGAGHAGFAVGFPAVGICDQPLGMGVEPVAPLPPAADDAGLAGNDVPPAGAETRGRTDRVPHRATAEPSHHLGPGKLAAAQLQQAAQGAANAGAGQRLAVGSGHGDPGHAQLVADQGGVRIGHAIEDGHAVQRRAALVDFTHDLADNPAQFVVGGGRDVQPGGSGEQRSV